VGLEQEAAEIMQRQLAPAAQEARPAAKHCALHETRCAWAVGDRPRLIDSIGLRRSDLRH
jgi:hypothetical protein